MPNPRRHESLIRFSLVTSIPSLDFHNDYDPAWRTMLFRPPELLSTREGTTGITHRKGFDKAGSPDAFFEHVFQSFHDDVPLIGSNRSRRSVISGWTYLTLCLTKKWQQLSYR